MKRFRFRYQALERLRNLQYQEAAKSLASGQYALQQAKNYKVMIEEQQERTSVRLNQIQSQGDLPLDEVWVEQQYLLGLEHRKVYAKNGIQRAEKLVKKALEKFQKNRVELKKVEKLHEKALEHYRSLSRKDETKKLEELYVMRASREGEDE
jgi:flagellar export protein FliJ